MNTKSALVQLLTMAAVVCCLYLPSVFNNGYNLDDTIVTQQHRLTSQGFSAIPEIFSSPYYQDDQGYAYDYRPIVLVSFAMEHSLFGESPRVGHFINLLLYISICSIVLLLLRNLFPQTHNWTLLFAVMLFALHPLHTEVVCSLKNRDILLSSLFSLGACWIVATFQQKRFKLVWVLLYILMVFGTLFSSLVGISLLLIIFPFIKVSRGWLGIMAIGLMAATNMLLVLRGTITDILLVANTLIVCMVFLAGPILKLMGGLKKNLVSSIITSLSRLYNTIGKMGSRLGISAPISLIVALGLLVFSVVLLKPVVSGISSNYQQYRTGVTVDPRAPEWNVSDQHWSDRGADFVEYPIGLSPDPTIKFGTGFRVLGKYIVHILFPYPMAFYYGYNTIPVVPVSNPLSILSILVHLAMLVAFIYFFNRSKIISFGLGLYLFSIGMFSNLAEPVLGLFADRATFLATIGSSILLSVAFFALTKRFFFLKGWIYALMGLVLIGYAYLTFERAALWKDKLTLMRSDILHVPNSAQAHNLLGHAIMEHLSKNDGTLTDPEKESLLNEAHPHFQQAYTIYPEFFNALVDDGRVLQILGNNQGALESFANAYLIDSTYALVVEELAYGNQAIGNVKSAGRYFEQLLRLTPDVLEVYERYSFMLYSTGKFTESIAINKRALSQNPSWTSPHENIARVERETGISVNLPQ